jgi:hypothetical protein
MEYISDTEEKYVTSLAEIHRLLSAKGQQKHLDDLDRFSTNYDLDNVQSANKCNALTEIYQRVTSRVMERLAPKYSINDVYRQPRIREIGTYMGAYLITKRRGNEPLYEADVLEGEDVLDAYREGTLYLDAPTIGTRVAIITPVVDVRSHLQPVKTVTRASYFSGVPTHRYRTYFQWLY